MRIGHGVILNEMGGVEIMFVLGNKRFGNHHFIHKPIVHRLNHYNVIYSLTFDP